MKQMTDKEYGSLENLYKYLHSNPELSGCEERTSGRMAEELETAGFKVTRHVGGSGVVGVLKHREGPTVMVRADMDALPIKEETGLPYASTIKTKDKDGNETGVMHACGHDMHMTVFVGAARLLARRKSDWRGTLMMIAQPEEESLTGAKRMLKDGLFKRFPKPDYMLGLHVMPFPAGMVGCHEGNWFAGTTVLDVTVLGQGGHAARPQETKDPVVLAAQIILSLQTIVSREIDPLDVAVVTVASIRGGQKSNIISDKVRMKLNIRYFNEVTRDKIIVSIKRIAKHTALAAGLPERLTPIVTIGGSVSPLYNDPELTRKMVVVLRKTLGENGVTGIPRMTGSEDFSGFGTVEPKIPIFFFGLGMIDPKSWKSNIKGKRANAPLHSSRFAPTPEPTIRTGVAAMTTAVLELLGKG
ncbi:MAG: amidohydrolase [Candidatus Omnitrophota bacterium]